MGKLAVITGGTGSLGFQTARAILAEPGWEVVITGRDSQAVAAAADRLGDRATGQRLELGSLAEVRRFARDLPSPHAVICNAGLVSFAGLRWTADGIEETFGVNHLAHFLLVRELLPRLPARARVVFVSSATHDPARRTGFPPPAYTAAAELAHPADEATEQSDRAGQRRYTAAKLCAVLTAYEFARRNPAEVASFNAFDPGQMPGTGLARDYRGLRSFVWRWVMPALTLVPGINRHTPARSGAALARLVVDPAFDGVTGGYLNLTRPVRSSVESYDLAKAADLWRTSSVLTDRSTR